MALVGDDERGGGLGRKLVAEMHALTHHRHGAIAINNAALNKAAFGQGRSLAALRDEIVGEGESAIVIAAGPSIRRHDPIKAIKESGYRGAVIATDSAIGYCLRNGVVPDLAVTVDPTGPRIVRWFGDPDLSPQKLAEDDYFVRQDLDTFFANQMRANEEQLRLFDRFGKSIRIAISTASSPAVVRRVLDTGMDVFWWNPMLDDPDEPDSPTARLQRENGMPAVNAGGNVGSACWMMASAVLEKRQVALTGVDFSYYDDTPYSATQYYHEAVALVGKDNLDSVYMRVHNPYLNAWFYTDPAYMWYRECLLEMTADADCVTWNCTEGGILFGDSVRFAPLAEFLKFNGTKGPQS